MAFRKLGDHQAKLGNIEMVMISWISSCVQERPYISREVRIFSKGKEKGDSTYREVTLWLRKQIMASHTVERLRSCGVRYVPMTRKPLPSFYFDRMHSVENKQGFSLLFNWADN